MGRRRRRVGQGMRAAVQGRAPMAAGQRLAGKLASEPALGPPCAATPPSAHLKEFIVQRKRRMVLPSSQAARNEGRRREAMSSDARGGGAVGAGRRNRRTVLPAWGGSTGATLHPPTTGRPACTLSTYVAHAQRPVHPPLATWKDMRRSAVNQRMSSALRAQRGSTPMRAGRSANTNGSLPSLTITWRGEEGRGGEGRGLTFVGV